MVGDKLHMAINETGRLGGRNGDAQNKAKGRAVRSVLERRVMRASKNDISALIVLRQVSFAVCVSEDQLVLH